MPETEGRVPTPPPLPEPKFGAENGVPKNAVLDLGKRGNLLAEIRQGGFKLKETGFKPK
jgi:hypothetical protein